MIVTRRFTEKTRRFTERFSLSTRAASWITRHFDGSTAADIITHCLYIRNVPYRPPGKGAFMVTENARARAVRVWAGSRMPSSHRRALAK
jgi:hypothetical protein